MSCVQLDGSHTRCRQKGESTGYQARKKAVTTNSIFLCDNKGQMIAMGVSHTGDYGTGGSGGSASRTGDYGSNGRRILNWARAASSRQRGGLYQIICYFFCIFFH